MRGRNGVRASASGARDVAAPKILIDTGAIYAFVTRSDRNHDAARAFVERWLGRRGSFVRARGVFAFDRHFSQMSGVERRPRR